VISNIPLFLVPVYVLIGCLALLQHALRRNSGQGIAVALLGEMTWLIFAIMFFGLRDGRLGTDSYVYILHAQSIESPHRSDSVSEIEYNFEPGYNVLVAIIVKLAGAARVLLVVEVLFVLLTIITCRLWFGSHSLLGLLGFISLFSYYNLAFNLIRTGLAIMLWLSGVSLFFRRRHPMQWIPVFAAAVMFHYTLLLPIFITLLVNVVSVKCLKWILLATITIELLFGGLTENLLRALSAIPPVGRYVLRYIGQQFDYRTGFRYDFLFYCLCFYFLIYYGCLVIQRMARLRKKEYAVYALFGEQIIGNYTLLVTMFVLAFGFPYSDRTGIFAFVLGPIGSLYVWSHVFGNKRVLWFIVLLAFCCLHFVVTMVYLHKEGTW
jgi:hypothetical protein